MNWIVILPIIIPLIITACVFTAWHSSYLQRLFTLIGSFINFLVAILLISVVAKQGYVTMQVGSWPAPFGITLVADTLSSLMVLTASLIGFCVVIFSLIDIKKTAIRKGFYPAYCILLAGLSGAFLTGDLFNLYVWFEIILISSFVLLSLTDGSLRLEGGVKYAVLNLIATLLLLTSIAFLYGISGTLNLADLSQHLASSDKVGLITTIAVLFIISFGIKAALFPLFFWLPASYHTTSYSASAIFSGVLSKVGVYALIRVFTLLFLQNFHYLHTLLLLIANLTLIVGIIGAIAQIELRRILSFTLISHIGFMVVGLAILTPLALAASIFYIIQHMLIKTSLFLSSGFVRYHSKYNDIVRAGDFYSRYPFFSLLFFIAAFSLAGIPPLSGFWAKVALIKASFDDSHYITLGIIVVTSFLTLFVIARLWQNLFLKAASHSDAHEVSLSRNDAATILIPITVLTALILLIGLFPAPLFHLAKQAATQLLNPAGYIHAVMKGSAS